MASQALENARAHLADAQHKIARLSTLEPYLIDLSLRENAFGSRVGQTLQDKLSILPRLRDFGFKNILLGTLDYAMPEELEVDDDFMMYLRDHHIDTTGGYAFTDIGILALDGTFTPSPSMRKMQSYCVPNTLHEIYLSREGMGPLYDVATLKRSLPASIEWLLQNCRGDGGTEPPRILINIVDGCDAFAEDMDLVGDILSLVAACPIEGVSIEDDRGTFMPFQVGAFVAAARGYLPAPLKLLVHMHSGGGFENASLIEALLQGADGVWGGLPKRAAIIGHASLGELIANLMRTGNPMSAYDVKRLLPLATSLQREDDLSDVVPDDLPILGANAYRMTLEFFRQTSRFMDLPAAAIGGVDGYRVGPLGSDAPILAGRLAEVTKRDPASFPHEVLVQMVRLMRRELRAGQRIVYDDPAELLQLYVRAGGSLEPTTRP